jgi:hypothetical protein
MTKRPSLFAQKSTNTAQEPASESVANITGKSDAPKPASRIGKRVLSVYLDPLAWKQLRQLALDAETTTQALGEEAVNLLFAKHGINRSA